MNEGGRADVVAVYDAMQSHEVTAEWRYRQVVSMAAQRPSAIEELHGLMPPERVPVPVVQWAWSAVLATVEADRSLLEDGALLRAMCRMRAHQAGVDKQQLFELGEMLDTSVSPALSPSGLVGEIEDATRVSRVNRDALELVSALARDNTPEGIEAALGAHYERTASHYEGNAKTAWTVADMQAAWLDDMTTEARRNERIQTGEATPEDQASGRMIRTGLTVIDDALGGLKLGGITYLGGATGTGKSTMAMFFTRSALRQGWPVAWLLAEMSPTEWYERAALSWHPDLSQQTGDPEVPLMRHADQVRKRAFPSEAWMREVVQGGVDEVARYRDDLVLHVPPKGRKWTSADVRWKLRMLARQGYKLVVLDYLQLITVPGHPSERWKQLEVFVEELKAEAGDLGLHVLYLGQLGNSRSDRPSLQNMRESKGIANPADNALLLWCPKPGPKEAADASMERRLLVDKARSGVHGAEARMTYIGELYRFVDGPPEATRGRR